jgi:hypothetical protein
LPELPARARRVDNLAALEDACRKLTQAR